VLERHHRARAELGAARRGRHPAPSPDPSYTTSVDIVVERVSVGALYPTAAIRLSLSCSTPQKFDLIVDLAQTVKADQGKQLVQGSTELFGYQCDPVNPRLIVEIAPTDPSFAFEPGRGTVRARIAGYQPGVEPADVTTRTRIVVE
jgi:hypothetical protein